MSVASGNGQFGSVMQPLDKPLVVEVKDDLGNPVAGRVIQFEVTRNSGTMMKDESGEPKRKVQVPTDGSGRALVLFSLGDTSGEGTNRVRATAVGVADEVEFCATGLAATPDKILMVMGDNQRGVVGHPLAIPMEALVVGRDGNPIKDLPVTYSVITSNGNLNGEQSLQRFTGIDGIARAVLTLGPDPGLNNNVVTATFPGMTGLPATFIASGLTPSNPDETRFSGVVVDNSFTPIPAATVFVEAANGFVTATSTDDSGQFLLESVPVGLIHLRIDGSTSDRPETFPALEFETVTVAGQSNILGQPIAIPPLDDEGSKIVGGEQDVTLTMKGVAGLELTVFANSVTCPLGTSDRSPDGKQCRVTISQVHLDKVPMPPPSGTFFMPPAWTIQPAGVQFDPPARISIPNDGLPPGRMIDIFQFDHSLNEFINVCKGTVSEDGFVIVSDPGFGITRADWGGCGQPQPPPTCGDTCADDNFCNGDESCQNGQCTPGSPKPPDTPRPANEQKPNDCKTLLCQGSEPNDSETPDVEHPQCNKCAGGEVKVDENKEDQACDTTGDPQRTCYVCQKGTCKKPDCKPSSSSENLDFDFGPLSKKIKEIEDKINNGLEAATKGRPIGLSVTFDPPTGGRTKSFTCCPDCTEQKPSDAGWEKSEYSLATGASIKGSLGFCTDPKNCSIRELVPLFDVRVIAGLSEAPSVELKLSAGGSGKGTFIDQCEADTCGSVKGDVTLSGANNAGVGVLAKAQDFDSSKPGCPPGLMPRAGLEEDSCWTDLLAFTATASVRLVSDKLASVEGELKFPFPGGQCLSSGGSCTFTAINAVAEVNFSTTGKAKKGKFTHGKPIKITLFKGLTGSCF